METEAAMGVEVGVPAATGLPAATTTRRDLARQAAGRAVSSPLHNSHRQTTCQHIRVPTWLECRQGVEEEVAD